MIVLPYGGDHRMGGTDPADLRLRGQPDRPAAVGADAGHPARRGLAPPPTSSAATWPATTRSSTPGCGRCRRCSWSDHPEGPARDWVRASIELRDAADRARRGGPLRSADADPRAAARRGAQAAPRHRRRQDGMAATPCGIRSSHPRWPRSMRSRSASGTSWRSPGRRSVSVSLLDERFSEVLGLAPIRYLTDWRMHVAMDLLRSSDSAWPPSPAASGTSPRRPSAGRSSARTGQAPSSWRLSR